MPARIQLKKSVLSISLPVLSPRHLLCGVLMLAYNNTNAADTLSNPLPQLKSQTQDHTPTVIPSTPEINAQAQITDRSLDFDDLEALPIEPMDNQLVNEIYRVAEQAKQEAQAYRAAQMQDVVVSDATQQEVAVINQAPVDVDTLMQNIQADREIVVQANATGEYLAESDRLEGREVAQNMQPGFFKRLLYRVRPRQEPMLAAAPRISAEVKVTGQSLPESLAAEDYEQALDKLKANISAKLSSFTQESFADFGSALPQLRLLSHQAAQAVGFYQADFRFEQVGNSKVRVYVTPNAPVLVQSQNIEFSGAGANQSQLRVIGVLPDLEEGAVLHHGQYQKTKDRITTAAANNGYFDAYWRLHDVKVAQPQNTADIHLRYETGNRYKLAKPTFRMQDPSKEFPLDMDVLESMVPYEAGDDYAFWRVNLLSNNLTNARYFNYALVEAVTPDPIEKQLELPPDLQALVDAEKLTATALQIQDQSEPNATEEVTQSVFDENQFAGTQDDIDLDNLERLRTQQQKQQAEKERLRQQAREEQVIPVLVTLNSDILNVIETGVGYGTDTGARLRSQYRRAIVNKRGHSFDANLELSEIRQSIDGRYSIPYNHPLNDYISLVGGYEREERNDVATEGSLIIESAVLGADRIIKNPRGKWQHTFGTRYRLDRLTEKGIVGAETSQDTFAQFISRPEQESLLFGYEASKTISDLRVNPTKGFKQTYRIDVGSENLLTDTNLAIVNATFNGLYSWGDSKNHQFVGRAQGGYIFADSFIDIPYNLRYFTGGDQSIRGFDYKSLSPIEEGYKVGGQALAIGSMEYNYQFKEGWRAAVFTDIGNAYDKKFSNDTAYGAGVGIRWASPIGPIRIDVASGLSDDGHPIRIHFFIGSAL
jgi:translocation and assembly module TamA